MKLTLKFIVFFVALISAVSAFAAPIPNFQKVAPNLHRGGLPGEAGLRYLKSIGVKTILNLDDKRSDIVAETRYAAQLGIAVISLPMSFFWRPRDSDVNAALAVMRNKSLRPLFVHCHQGKDRTGLIVGLHRVEKERWHAGDAYDEMLEYGFHDQLFNLKNYFAERTGAELDY